MGMRRTRTPPGRKRESGKLKGGTRMRATPSKTRRNDASLTNATGLALDPEIEALNLSPAARNAAYILKQAHRDVIFTSGRRNKQDQARAMSENVILNRKWIEQTYALNLASASCQRWVDEHPDKTTQEEIEDGLASVIFALPEYELAKLSKHLSGDAFDVQPVEEGAEEIKATIRRLPGLKLFLDMEGGLIRWHAQF